MPGPGEDVLYNGEVLKINVYILGVDYGNRF